MLDELAPLLTPAKTKELVGRLEMDRTSQAIGAEYELGLCWAVSRSFQTELEPDFRSRPDMLVHGMFSRPTVIEVTAVSDAGFSQEEEMRRASNILNEAAASLKKGSRGHLRFQFTEHIVKRKGRSIRERRVTKDFELSEPLRELFRQWLYSADPNPVDKVRLTDEAIDVVIEWSPYVFKDVSFFSSMPAVGQDLEDNAVFKALKTKAKKQLAGIGPDYLKCIFLCDAGCRLLDSGLRTTRRGFEFSGEEIILHFLKRYDIDIVCVFSVSPWQPRTFERKSRQWLVRSFSDQDLPPGTLDQLHKVCAQLPRPRLSGYQARSQHQQGLFEPNSGQYMGTTMRSGGPFSPVTFTMSARALQEHLAGRMSEPMFKNIIGAQDRNYFGHWLDQGYQISAARIVPGGIDEDDDQIEFTFSFDPAATKLRSPQSE